MSSIIDTIPLIDACLSANIPVMLSGPPGVGKSDLTRQLVKKRAWAIIDKFRASTIDAVDLRGVPSVVNGLTYWNPPADLPIAERDGPEGVLFLDEINSGNPAVQAAMYQLVLERSIGNYVMPPGWRIMAAGNRVEDKAVASRLSTALASRFEHFDIDPDFASFKLWANANGILPEIVAFLEWCEKRGNSLLHKMPQPGQRAFPCPRTWSFVSKILQHTTPDMAFEIAKGGVGEAAAIEFQGFLDVYRDLPRLPDIYSNPTSARVPLEPAAIFAVTAALARDMSAKTLQPATEYLSRLPVEFNTMAMTDAVRRDPSLKVAPGYTAWAAQHGAHLS